MIKSFEAQIRNCCKNQFFLLHEKIIDQNVYQATENPMTQIK